ncbi:MAG: hypothetical protein AAGI66_03835 [Cyanobacteria bacterium P01_H01_bin.74]
MANAQKAEETSKAGPAEEESQSPELPAVAESKYDSEDEKKEETTDLKTEKTSIHTAEAKPTSPLEEEVRQRTEQRINAIRQEITRLETILAILQEPVDPSTKEPADPSAKEPMSPSTKEPMDPSTKEPAVPSAKEPMGPSTKEPAVPSAFDRRIQAEKNQNLEIQIETMRKRREALEAKKTSVDESEKESVQRQIDACQKMIINLKEAIARNASQTETEQRTARSTSQTETEQSSYLYTEQLANSFYETQPIYMRLIELYEDLITLKKIQGLDKAEK